MDTCSEREALALLENALELPACSQESYLESICKGRESLHVRVEELLEASRRAGTLPVFHVESRRGRETGVLPTEESHGDGGAVVGSYRLLNVLGKGGMGVVYRAKQRRPYRDVALKVIRSRYLHSEKFLRRFEREADLLGKLDHPGIARIYDAGTAIVSDAQVPFMAIELIEGKPLLEHVEKACREVQSKLDLIAQIADAVHSAHQKSVVHRDLKPGNILVTESGQPKILDFGIATSTAADVDEARRTQVGELIGTLAYMSPEQARCDIGRIDARSDIYSLGLLGYELLAGEPAFDVSRNPLEVVLRRLVQGEPKLLGKIWPEFRGDVEAVFAKACRLEPSERYGSAAAFADDVRRISEHRPIAARQISSLNELRKCVQRNRVAASAIGVAFLALLIGIGVAFWGLAIARASREVAVGPSKEPQSRELQPQKPQRMGQLELKKRAFEEFKRLNEYGHRALPLKRTSFMTYQGLSGREKLRSVVGRVEDDRWRLFGETYPRTLSPKRSVVVLPKNDYGGGQEHSEYVGSNHLFEVNASNILRLYEARHLDEDCKGR